MLILPRRKNESITIGNDVVVTVVDVQGDRVRLGVVHPRGMPVHRQEVPVVWLDPTWLRWNKGTVVCLARDIEAGDCELLPVLGDALEEAGCADPAILGHCRSGGPYPRWSWLVKQILEEA
jgi:carbon storage regulator CsrA